MDLIFFQVFDEVVPRDGDDRAEERDPGARHHHRRRHGHEHPPQGRQDDHQEPRPRQPRDHQHPRQQHQVSENIGMFAYDDAHIGSFMAEQRLLLYSC